MKHLLPTLSVSPVLTIAPAPQRKPLGLVTDTDFQIVFMQMKITGIIYLYFLLFRQKVDYYNPIILFYTLLFFTDNKTMILLTRFHWVITMCQTLCWALWDTHRGVRPSPPSQGSYSLVMDLDRLIHREPHCFKAECFKISEVRGNESTEEGD